MNLLQPCNFQFFKGKLIPCFKILIATVLIFFLFHYGHLDFSIVLNIRKHPWYLLAGFICCLAAMLAPILRWRILILVQKLPISCFGALRLAMIGYFFNIFIPGGAGGDVIRVAYTVRACPERKPHALTIAIVDRGLGVHSLLLMGCLSIFFQSDFLQMQSVFNSWSLVIVCLLILGTIAPLLLIWDCTNGFLIQLCGRIIGGRDAWHEAMKLYRAQPGKLVLAYFFSILSAIFNILLIHLMMLAVDASPTITESLIIVPLVILANSLPISPGGIGVGESASAALYLLIGQHGGANGMLLARFFIISFALLGLPFYLFPFNSSLPSGGKYLKKSNI